MRIQNNLPAMNTHRYYNIANGAVASSAEKLSSGYRINRAGDDAAGLAISEKMRAQIRGLNMASKNSSDAISLVQTAEGALQSTHDILQRMRELSVQAASDTNETAIDRRALDLEFQALITEIDDIASKTRFNDQTLIDGTFAKQKSIVSGTSIGTLTGNIILGDAVAGAHTLAVTSQKVGVVTGVNAQVIGYDYGTASVATGTASVSFTLGAATNAQTSEFNSTYTLRMVDDTHANSVRYELRGLNGVVMEGWADLSASAGAGTTTVSINFAGYGTMTISASGLINQSNAGNLDGVQMTIDKGVTANAGTMEYYATLGGDRVRLENGMTELMFETTGVYINLSDSIANAGSAVALSVGNMSALTAVLTGSITITNNVQNGLIIQTGANKNDETTINVGKMDSVSLGVAAAKISTQLTASDAIKTVNNAINKISMQRAELGALQNRLEFKIANLDTSAENLQAAESRIRDVDMAKEMTAFSKKNILTQAATAMLAQANTLPQNVLQLLR